MKENLSITEIGMKDYKGTVTYGTEHYIVYNHYNSYFVGYRIDTGYGNKYFLPHVLSPRGNSYVLMIKEINLANSEEEVEILSKYFEIGDIISRTITQEHNDNKISFRNNFELCNDLVMHREVKESLEFIKSKMSKSMTDKMLDRLDSRMFGIENEIFFDNQKSLEELTHDDFFNPKSTMTDAERVLYSRNRK